LQVQRTVQREWARRSVVLRRQEPHHAPDEIEPPLRVHQPVPHILPASSGAAERAMTPPPPDRTFGEADLSSVRTIPVAVRQNKVSAREFAHPPGIDRSFGAFLDALPDVLVARDFRAVVNAI